MNDVIAFFTDASRLGGLTVAIFGLVVLVFMVGGVSALCDRGDVA